MQRIAIAALILITTNSALVTAQEVDFDRDIRPILSNSCLVCHGPDENERATDLRLDSKDSVFKKRDALTVVPNAPEKSELIRRIFSADADEQMPPADSGKILTDAQRELLKQWVTEGANWDEHWAWEAPTRPGVPELKNKWITNPIDAFVLSRLKQNKLSPATHADKVTLIRRLSFDLTGLPPTPAQVDAYLADNTGSAYSNLVASLMESPAYGERLAMYWLDVVRYADSNGYHSDEARQISPYRDYVIESFQNNMPYDQFIIEQLAGDLLENPTVDQKIASGFNMLLQTTSEGGAQAKEYTAKYAADRVRNTASIFMGVTLGCAECHDHKYDPFTTKDFYSFAAFFADVSEIPVGNPRVFPVITKDVQARIDQVQSSIAEQNKIIAEKGKALSASQAKWEATILESAIQTVQMDDWHYAGPIQAANFDEAHAKSFIDESAPIDLTAKVADKPWTKSPQFENGKVHALNQQANSAHYLFRKLSTKVARKLELRFGSDDGLRVWLNGKLVHDNKITRGSAADQDKFEVELGEGENTLLVKISQSAGGAGFYFNINQSSLPADIIAIAELDAGKRDAAQQKKIADYYFQLAPELKEHRDAIAKLQADEKEIRDAAPRTMMTVATAPRTIRVLPRGNWLDESGEIVEPRTPSFLKPLPEKEGRYDRLDLANWLIDRENPLTARAMVNRLWKLYFGHGLSDPLDDLGGQGERPSHPELLDWLSMEFVESGWDIKHMVTLIVSSNTYQQSSLSNDDLDELDPYNRLYARQSRFRLDAEMVRDNALAVSGLLVPTIGGPSVKPYQPAGYWAHMNFPKRTWQADMDNNQYRRGLYTWWQRMFLHPSMVAFDAPSREECTVERPRSNTPQQALVLLNDPTYVEAARSLAERVLLEGGESTADKLQWLYKVVLSRSIEPHESKVLNTVLTKQLERYNENTEAAKQYLSVGQRPMNEKLDTAALAAWTSICRVILNLHETITRT